MSWFSSGRSYVSRDLEDYRAHYPDNSDNPKLNKNLNFFQNTYPMQPEGVLIEDVLSTWKGRYRHLESSHSFIQWLFPIQEKGMNWESQVLQKHEIAAMKADPIILRRVIGVFRIMLNFYGMELVDEEKAIFKRLDDYKPQYRNLNTSSHNYLRITRILKNLGEMGFEHLKIGWLNFLFEEICISRLLANCETSFWNYWSGTIYDDRVRAAFLTDCKTRVEEARDSKRRRAEGAVESGISATSSSATMASFSADSGLGQTSGGSVVRQTAPSASPSRNDDGNDEKDHGSAERLSPSSTSTFNSSTDNREEPASAVAEPTKGAESSDIDENAL